MQTIFTLAQTTTPATVQNAPVAKQTLSSSAPSQTTATTRSAAKPDARQEPQSLASSLGSFLPMIVIIGVMVYFMWSSQKKERKRREELVESVKAGVRVVTIGGIIGEVVSVKENQFTLEIASGVRVQVDKNAVSRVVKEEEPVSKEEKK